MRTARDASVRCAAAPAAVAILLLAAGSIAGQASPDSVPFDAARLGGEVVDVESGTPVPGASILVASLDGGPDSTDHRIETDDGTFSLPPLPSGRYLILVEGLGYRTLTDTLALAAAAETRVELGLVPEALDLEPLVALAVRRKPSFMRAFEHRRAMGFGRFLDRDEIANRRAFAVSDLFRTVPGVRVVPGALPGGAGLALRGGCQPEVYVDGIPSWGGVSLDAKVRPHDIEAIEVYTTAGAPARFMRGGCGVVLIWTRAPPPSQAPDDRSFWPRLGILSGLLVVGVLLGG